MATASSRQGARVLSVPHFCLNYRCSLVVESNNEEDLLLLLLLLSRGLEIIKEDERLPIFFLHLCERKQVSWIEGGQMRVRERKRERWREASKVRE